MSDIVPLIEFRDGVYVAREDTLEWLAGRDKPFAVVTCAGKFRTGKSFLLNRLLNTPPGMGFGVGETVQACTRGLWVCKRFLRSEEEDGVDLLVCDTEGIDALDAESEHDVRVFALAVLLSSVFVYNSQSHLDEAAVQTLSLMTRIAERVGGKHDPHLYWVLRDFSLQLTDSSGRSITHKEYLEQSLVSTSGDKCKTREAIKHVFETRHLVTLPRPHSTDSAQMLDQRGVTSKFDRFLTTFRTHMLKHSKPVSANGVPMTGTVYVAYVRHLLTTLNQTGVIPKLEDSWSMLCRAQAAEVEARFRSELLDRLATECPYGEASEIRRWIQSHRFDVPQGMEEDQRSAVHKRVVEDVYRACVAAGRVMTAHDLARQQIQRLATERLFLRIPDGELDEVGKVAKYGLGCGYDLGVEAGLEAATRDGDVARRTLEVTNESLRDEIRSLQAIVPVAVRTDDRVRVDACVGTDHPWLEEADEVQSIDTDALLHATLLQEKDDTIQILTEEATSVKERLKTLTAVFDDRMDKLHTITNDRIENMTRDLTHHKEVAERESRQKQVLVDECDKNRGLVKDAQEKALEVHRSMLDELRRRDVEVRTVSEDTRKEWSGMTVRLELAENENRGLKRRLEEMMEVEAETKRLRSQLQQTELDKTRSEVQHTHLKTQVDTLRQETHALRRTNSALESRMAVLLASSKLENGRRPSHE